MVVFTSLRQAQGRLCGRVVLEPCGHLPRPQVLGVVAVLEEVGGETVSKGVGGDGLVYFGEFGGLANGFLKDAFVEAVAADDAGERVHGTLGGREDELPGPFPPGVGIFDVERVWQGRFPIAFPQVFIV